MKFIVCSIVVFGLVMGLVPGHPFGLIGGMIGLAGGMFGLIVGTVFGLIGGLIGGVVGLAGALFGVGVGLFVLSCPLLILGVVVFGLLKLATR